MITKIDGHTLTYPLYFKNEHSPDSIIQEIEESLGGTAIIYERPRLSGQKIQLTTPKDSYIKPADVAKLKALANGMDSFYIEDEDTNTIKVHIDRTSGGIKIEPIQPKHDWFTAEINLITVE